MEGDAGRDANKSFGYWAGLVTLRETENLKNQVRFFEYPPNTPVMELEYILTLKGSGLK